MHKIASPETIEQTETPRMPSAVTSALKKWISHEYGIGTRLGIPHQDLQDDTKWSVPLMIRGQEEMMEDAHAGEVQITLLGDGVWKINSAPTKEEMNQSFQVLLVGKEIKETQGAVLHTLGRKEENGTQKP